MALSPGVSTSMSELIVSVSGVRGVVGESLTREVVERFTRAADAAHALMLILGNDGSMESDMLVCNRSITSPSRMNSPSPSSGIAGHDGSSGSHPLSTACFQRSFFSAIPRALTSSLHIGPRGVCVHRRVPLSFLGNDRKNKVIMRHAARQVAVGILDALRPALS